MLNPDGTENTSAVFIGNINPIRYRSYYFDTETGFYYLNARYYDPQIKRFLNSDTLDNLGANGDLNAFNLYAYCSNNPMVYIFQISVSRRTIASNTYSINMTFSNVVENKANVSCVGETRRKMDFNLFGYELRMSSGWEYSPNLISGKLGIIGVSSYTTYSQGREGSVYAFAGGTLEQMSLFGMTWYAGVGVDLFDAVGAEFQVKTVGIGTKFNVCGYFVESSVNLAGGTTVTIGMDTDIGNGYTLTNGFTIGINTGCLVAVVYGSYVLLTTGDISVLQAAFAQ